MIRRPLSALTWKIDAQGRQVVEPKDQTKKRLGRSPDDADALNLAFDAETATWSDAVVSDEEMAEFVSEARGAW